VRALAEAEDKKVAAIRAARAAGNWTVLRGERVGTWKGGAEAARERKRTPEKRKQQREALRVYRAKNPHKVREWKHRRDNGKVLPRLPYGTIPRLGGAQRWRCAICRVSIRAGYHLDHIMPIARGGLHEPRNLQLLCATCNVRKNAKDPITYMQEIGRLL
jgi:5-methylcytosine-specific restriction endonuclease McrA